MSIRAVRNNNPGNIDRGQPWQGLMPPERMNAEQKAEPRFAVFQSPAWGFRAIVKILQSYATIFHGQGKTFCPRNIIARWAPPSENLTEAYDTHVCLQTGYTPDQPLEPVGSVLRALARAISVHEVGGWAFTDADLDEGVRLAGL